MLSNPGCPLINLYARRKQLGYTQKALSQAAHVHHTTLSNVENGHVAISYPLAVEVAKILRIPWWLLYPKNATWQDSIKSWCVLNPDECKEFIAYCRECVYEPFNVTDKAAQE